MTYHEGCVLLEGHLPNLSAGGPHCRPTGWASPVRPTPVPRRAPVRLQRRRTKGWRTPAGAVYVGRPTRWGNPYPLEGPGSLYRAASIRQFVEECDDDAGGTRLEWLVPLVGRDLMCWCPLDVPCHADYLLARANGWAYEPPWEEAA